MMCMDIIKMHEILKKTSLSDEDAHALVDEILSSVNRAFNEKKEILATKEIHQVYPGGLV